MRRPIDGFWVNRRADLCAGGPQSPTDQSVAANTLRRFGFVQKPTGTAPENRLAPTSASVTSGGPANVLDLIQNPVATARPMGVPPAALANEKPSSTKSSAPTSTRRKRMPTPSSLKEEASTIDEPASIEDGPTEAWVDPVDRRNRRRWFSITVAFALAIVLISLLAYIAHLRNETTSTETVSISNELRFAAFVDRASTLDPPRIHVQLFPVEDTFLNQTDAEKLGTIETFIVDAGLLTDASMPKLASMPNLGHVRLRFSPITDQGLKSLSESASIWLLNLPHARCTSEGVAHLSAMPRLRSLRLGSPQLSGDVARAIADIQTLRTVHLIGVPITDDGLRRIAAMPQLESLYLDDSAVTDAGWRWLFENHGHLHVHINQTHHDNDPHQHSHRE